MKIHPLDLKFFDRIAKARLVYCQFLAFFVLFFAASTLKADDRPNILLILCDDMGFSDMGCYGGEIDTPHLDRLATNGIRFTQFYNTAKCFPSRACLLTGVYAQQCGMAKKPAKIQNAVTFGEVLRKAGYRTLWSGKHHGTENPVTRGFDRYYGVRDGGCNHFNPGLQRPGEPEPAQKKPGDRYWCIDDKTFHPYTPKEKDFYTTDAFTDQALKWLEEYKNEDRPFLLYVAYTAPHNPLMAWPKDIAKYRGKYREGYKSIRNSRYKRQVEMGLIDPKIYPLSKRESPKKKTKLPEWEKLPPEARDQEDLRMAVYAAMIDRMDQNIGRILAKIRELGEEENTVVLFCSDNGGSFEKVDIGSGEFGPTMSRWVSVDAAWANVSNTPFRKYKTFSHEGGICTPLIVSWPKGIKKGGQICREPGHFIDVMPTLLEITGADYPTEYNDMKVTPLQGTSLIPAFRGEKLTRDKPIFWQWQHGRAIRDGKWKLVSYRGPWELYDLSVDRTETKNLAKKHPKIVKRLSKMWQKWYDDCYLSALAEKKPSMPVQQVKMPVRGICAHRGASDTHPENTLAAFREAVRLGAHQIEMDVRLTKDGKLVVIHDPTVDRTTDGTGKVSDLTLTEIKRLDAGKKKHARFLGSRVPTLAEALAIMPRNVWLNLHLKGKNQKLGRKVAREIMRQNRTHQAFLACGEATAKGAREACPDILICNMEGRNNMSDYVNKTIKKKCRFIQLQKKVASPEEMRRLKAAGVSINLYEGPNVKSLKKAFEAGVDFPLVNDVEWAMKEAKKYGVKPRKAVYK